MSLRQRLGASVDRARPHPPPGPLPRARRHPPRPAPPPRTDPRRRRGQARRRRPAQRRAQPGGDDHRRQRHGHRSVRRTPAHPRHRARPGDGPRGRRRRPRQPLADLQPGLHPRLRSPPGSVRVPTSRARTSASDSSVTSTTTSSPTRSTVSPRGTISVSSRSTATTVASRGHAEVDDLLAVGRRALGEAHLGQPGLAALERQQADERADADRLLDQRGDEVRRRHRDVDAPQVVEHPLVLRVVHPGDDPGHAELLLGEQRDRRGCPRRRR